MTSDELWFDRPADSWLAALPLGNGHIGVMAHGGVDVEHLQVNDATAWSGSPRSEQAGTPVDTETAAAAISGARDAVAAEDFDEAGRLLKSLQHRHSQSYLPFVDLRIASAVTGAASMEATDYRRSLDLASASYSLRYRVGGFEVRRQVFVSHPHDVGVVTIDTDCPAGLDLSIALSSLLRVTGSGSTPDDAWMTLRLPTDVSPTHDECEEPVSYSGEPGASMEGAIALSWTHDGQAGVSGTAATGVHAATIVFSTRTTFAGIAQPPQGSAGEVLAKARGRVSAAFEEGIDCVRTSQRADHAALYDRVRISTGPPPGVDLPTDERLRQGNAGADGALSIDPALAGLLYSFGRYLLISSSRPGGVPANLQGIWNDQLQPPWSSNYTTNINVEMNYWPAEVANLSELASPLFDLIDGLTVTGARTARRIYQAPGWVAHHNTDPWAYSQPVGGGAMTRAGRSGPLPDPGWSATSGNTCCSGPATTLPVEPGRRSVPAPSSSSTGSSSSRTAASARSRRHHPRTSLRSRTAETDRSTRRRRWTWCSSPTCSESWGRWRNALVLRPTRWCRRQRLHCSAFRALCRVATG